MALSTWVSCGSKGWTVLSVGANMDIVSFAMRTPQGDALKSKVVRNITMVDKFDALIELE